MIWSLLTPVLVHWKDWCESWNSNTLATWCEELMSRPWCWERLKAKGEGDDWMAPPTWSTWVWVSFRSWWWTGKPGMLQSMGSQGVRHDWATELSNWTELNWTPVPQYTVMLAWTLTWIQNLLSFQLFSYPFLQCLTLPPMLYQRWNSSCVCIL